MACALGSMCKRAIFLAYFTQNGRLGSKFSHFGVSIRYIILK